MLNECELTLAQATKNNVKIDYMVDQSHDTQQRAKLF